MEKKDNEKPINRFIPGISCFSWNSDATKIAVCPGTKDILVLSTEGSEEISEWKLDQVLSYHYAIVTSLHWHPGTDWLLSCSSDRAALVWKPNEVGKMTPQLVIMKEKRANLDACWNMRGDKFLIGSSSGLVYQCFFEAGLKFWVHEKAS
jgi:actin related protein 2/3 complex subunit 1A/1B